MNDAKSALRHHLRKEILTLGLTPGEVLDETVLSSAFALSRTPTREVFRDLAGEGYLDVTRGRGARVAAMSHESLRSFFLVAPLIYEAILKLAALQATDVQLAELRRAQDSFRETLRKGSAADRTLANIRFHEITGEMAGNVFLLPSFRRLLIDHARIGMTFYLPRTRTMSEKLTKAAAQHDEIIAAIEARDEARAATLAQAHWELSRSEIESYVMPNALTGQLGRNLRGETA